MIKYMKTISSKGQFVIPAPIRLAMNLRPGDSVIWHVNPKKQQAMITAMPKGGIVESVAGSLAGAVQRK